MRYQSIVVSLALLFSQSAWALVTLKQVQVTSGEQIDLLFDSKISLSQIETDFFKDTIQLSLNNVSVYPAKISSVKGEWINKVFTYQYSPKLVRCRLSVNGSAEDFKNRVKLSPDGNRLTIRLGGAVSDVVTTQAAKSVSRPSNADESAALAGEEKALLERVLKETPAKVSVSSKTNTETQTAKVTGTPSSVPLRSPVGVMLKLLGVLALFLGGVLMLKRWITKGGSKNGIPGSVGRFMRKRFGARGSLVDVLATHYLGPKKSISVVKVAGRVLVLGVTNDAVNLITELPADGANAALGLVDELTGDADIDSEIAALGPLSKHDRSQGPSGASHKGEMSFGDILGAANSSSGPSPTRSTPSASTSSVRSKIKSKLEGLKPL